jgi:serine/threonine protein kinase
MPVALKVAQWAEDPRFEREVGLLSRLHHPSLPKLLDRGWWRSSTGEVYPYVVMEWIRGQTLYEWGRRTTPTSRQVMKVMAQLAWGLEVVHRAEGLHRDVRGDNILVEPEGRAVLADFGSCTWRGAPPLTQRVMPPNTREYRSPEALLFERENWNNKETRYEAGTADDLYALAVSMYRLVTGEYPPPAMPAVTQEEPYEAPPEVRMHPQALNPRVVREFAELVERALVEEPQARGCAREIAQEADSAALHAGPDADVPLFVECSAAQASKVSPAPTHTAQRSRPRTVKAALGAVTALAVIVFCQGEDEPHERESEVAWIEAQGTKQAQDGGTKGLGEEALSARVDAQETPAPASSTFSEPVPKDPLPGQRRPPCPRPEVVEINGGCWYGGEIKPPCGDFYEWQGACYLPVMGRTRVPTTQEP